MHNEELRGMEIVGQLLKPEKTKTLLQDITNILNITITKTAENISTRQFLHVENIVSTINLQHDGHS